MSAAWLNDVMYGSVKNKKKRVFELAGSAFVIRVIFFGVDIHAPQHNTCGAYNAEATSTLFAFKIMPAGSQDSSEAMSGWVHKGLAMSWPFLALSVVILLTLQNGNDINITSDTGPAIEVRESSL